MAQEIEIKPMTPQRLDELRAFTHAIRYSLDHHEKLVAELLAAHDYFRNRADVNSGDVEAAGVTVEKCEAWLTQNGWTLASHPDNRQRTWWKNGEGESANIWLDGRPLTYIAVIITLRARDAKRPAFDILEEMAAL